MWCSDGWLCFVFEFVFRAPILLEFIRLDLVDGISVKLISSLWGNEVMFFVMWRDVVSGVSNIFEGASPIGE